MEDLALYRHLFSHPVRHLFSHSRSFAVLKTVRILCPVQAASETPKDLLVLSDLLCVEPMIV